MAPKKKEQQKMSLGDFLGGSGFGGGSWADEVEETYVSGTQALPPARDSGRSMNTSSWQDRGYSVRESVPAQLPEKPPFTAHLGNLSYDATNESVTDFFDGCDVVSVRIIEDREMQRPKGFGYVEFGNLDGLKKALTLDGQSFEGRMIKIKVADPPRGGDGREARGESARDLSEWTRKGPLPDLPGARGPRSDFGERRPPRDPATDGRSTREMTWERRGPLSPLAPQEPGSRESSRARGPQEGLGERSESYRGNRRDAPAWGEGRQEGGRPPRQYNERPERPERPERTPTAAEKDFQWRDRMRPDAANAPPAVETPASPGAAPPAQAPGGRPRLNLQKRTVSEVADSSSSAAGDAKASPFGAARPIDTAAREKEIEEKRLQAIQEKKEADEKAKEERRLAKEAAAAKAEADAEAEAEAEAKQATEASKAPEAPEAAEANVEAKTEAETETKAEEEPKTEQAKENGASEQKVPIRTRDQPKDFSQGQKSRATESGNWRSATNEQRVSRGNFRGSRGGGRGGRDDGAPRGPRNENRAPRSNGQQAAAPAAEGDTPAPAADEDGWTTVATGKKGRTGRV